MIGLTNAGVGLDETSIDSKLELFYTQRVVPTVNQNKGYVVDTITSTGTVEPAWNRETRINSVENTTQILLGAPSDTQSQEVRITFKVGASGSVTPPTITWGFASGVSGYSYIWPDETNNNPPVFNNNCLYEISLTPIAEYIVGYSREVEIPSV